MLIDWFTVAAQILNFLILVGLLKKFLYAPIMRAMDEREAKIAERLEDARREKQEAEREAEEFRRKNREFDARREQMMQQSKAEAEAHRKELLHRVRSETEQKKRGWREAVVREQEAFLQDLRSRAGENILAISRQALKDLADQRMERQVVQVFLERLEDADSAQMKDFDDPGGDKQEPMTVFSAFELPGDLRERISAGVQHWLGAPVALDFQVSRDLLSGIELRANGRKVAWHLKDYLDSLEESMRSAMDEVADFTYRTPAKE